MNQIPNIEETHSTREVEEIIEEKIKGYYEDIEQHERTKQAIKNKEIVYIGEFGNVLCEEDYFAWEEWVDSVAIGGSSREKFIKVNLNLHHQLQKAREEERERCIKIVEDYGKSMSNLHSEMIGTAHEDSKMMLAFDMHSRLIAVKHITKKMNHSELDQPTV